MIYILTGPVASGKMTFLQDFIRECKKYPETGARSENSAEVPVYLDGYLSLRVLEGKDTAGYDLWDLKYAKSWPFLRKKGQEVWQRVGAYYVVPEGLAHAEEIIRRSHDSGLLVVDEIGHLELEGRGVWPVLKQVLFDGKRRFLVVIRKNLVKDFLEVFIPAQVTIFEQKDKENLLKIFSREEFISVKVKFFAYFREIFNAKEKDLSFAQSATIRELLDLLCDTPERRAEVFENDQLKPHLIIMKNGAAIQPFEGLKAGLSEGDVVSIFPLMGGG